MCGPDTSPRPRYGALAALVPPSTAGESLSFTTHGDLNFYTPGRPSSPGATHVRLTPDPTRDASALGRLHVVIHTSGDLTKSAANCGLFRRFDLPDLDMSDYVELSLDELLPLEVGNGIIGRRVSLCSRGSCGEEIILAEGIVGYNFAESAA